MAGGVRTGIGLGFGLVLGLLIFLVGCPVMYFTGCLAMIGLASKAHDEGQRLRESATTRRTDSNEAGERAPVNRAPAPAASQPIRAQKPSDSHPSEASGREAPKATRPTLVELRVTITSPKTVRLAIENAPEEGWRAVAESFRGREVSWKGTTAERYRRATGKRYLTFVCGGMKVTCLFDAMPSEEIRKMKEGETASINGVIQALEKEDDGKIKVTLKESEVYPATLTKEQRRSAEEKAAKHKTENKRQEQIAEARAKRKATEEADPRSKGMGQTLSIGYTSYRVHRAWWSDHLSKNQFLDKRANAEWLFLQVSVRNDDQKARMIPPFNLIDENGAEYDAEAALIENSIEAMDSLNPSVTKQGLVVFDVPKNHQYRLKVSGGYWSGEDGFIRITPGAE